MKNTTPKVWQDTSNRTQDFLIQTIYERQLKSSKARGHDKPNYTLTWLKEWVKSQPEFQSLFDTWVNSDCQTTLIPSVDRFDDAIGYTKENLHKVMTWQDNKRRGELLRSQGISRHKRYKEVHQFNLEGTYIDTYHSARAAYLALGVKPCTHIIEVCEGKRKLAEGFIWSFDKNGSDVLSRIKHNNKTLRGRAICGFNDTDYIELDSSNSGINIGVHGANIQKCLYGERNKAGGYSWKYLDEYILELLNDIENTSQTSKEKIHHSQIHFNEDTCLVSIQ